VLGRQVMRMSKEDCAKLATTASSWEQQNEGEDRQLPWTLDLSSSQVIFAVAL